MDKLDGSCRCGKKTIQSITCIGLQDGALSLILMYLCRYYLPNPYKLNDIFDFGIHSMYLHDKEDCLTVLAVCSILIFLVSALLVLGASCKSRRMLRPWILLAPVAYIGYICLITYLHVCLSHTYDNLTLVISNILCIAFITSSGIQKYKSVIIFYDSLTKPKRLL